MLKGKLSFNLLRKESNENPLKDNFLKHIL